MKANSEKSVISRFWQFLNSNWWSLRRRIGVSAFWVLVITASALIVAIAGRVGVAFDVINISYTLFDAAICILSPIIIFLLCKNRVNEDSAQTIIAFIGLIMASAFIGVMIFDNISDILQEGFGVNDNMNPKNAVLEFIGLGIGGVIAVYGLIALNKRAAAQDKANELTRRELSQERLKVAVDHLSNRASKTARIASFYELYYLARDNQNAKDDYAQTVLDILCAHLRHITNPKTFTGKTTEEVDTLIGILFERSTATVFHQLHFNLQRVHLPGIDFRNKFPPKNVDFRYANLSKAIFSEGADLESANFMGANLRGIELEEANLLCANFMDAHLQDANLMGATLHFANLQKARLWNTNLCGAEFLGAELCDAVLQEADLQEADFSDADLNNADFSDADLRGAHLHSAKNSETAIFAGATLKY